MSPKIVCVVPTNRPERMESFKKAWAPLFEKHDVTLITVWDGEVPEVQLWDCKIACDDRSQPNADLFCRFTDACRNLGFVTAAALNPEYILTLDDDVLPVTKEYLNDHSFLIHDWCDEEVVEILDPIQMHLNTLNLRVSLSWMNTAHSDGAYVRGMPYNVRNEARVMLSHGVWVGVPDFDGETQILLEQGGNLPKSLPYYVGPIPKGVLFPVCGMSVMIRREALSYFYFAPMGPDSGVDGLHRFADIWMGIFLKRKFDELGWACYTGGSVVHHTRASDAKKNMEQEKLSREWNERKNHIDETLGYLAADDPYYKYFASYADKRERYAKLITDILKKG